MNKFIFDVDGTLTPSRQKIDSSFEDFFLVFCQSNSVTLVTGSDRIKTIEQLGSNIVDAVDAVYNCSGNDVWIKGNNIRTSDWKLPALARTWLEGKLKESKFILRTGNHIEERPGSINFSTVGRNATLGERKLYIEFDQEHREREKLVSAFNHTFKDLEARIGGETGIDIFEKGRDKSQILADFSSKDKLYFFGDKINNGGNDYPLADAITKKKTGMWIQVNGWKDTFETLQFYQEAKIAV